MIIDYSFPAATAAHLQRNLNSTANTDADANREWQWAWRMAKDEGEEGSGGMGSQEWSMTMAPFASAFWLRWRHRHRRRRRGHRHPFELLNWTAELCSYWNCLVADCSSCCHLPLLLPLCVCVIITARLLTCYIKFLSRAMATVRSGSSRPAQDTHKYINI